MADINLIGVSGKIHSGKDTVGRIIQYLTWQRVNYWNKDKTFAEFTAHAYETPWQTKAFAYKLKQIVSLLTGIPLQDLMKQEVKDSFLGPEWDRAEEYFDNHDIPYYIKVRVRVRELLQRLGTDALRNNVHPNIHINALFADRKPLPMEAYIPNATFMDGYHHKSCATCKREFSGYKVQRNCESCIKANGILYPKWIITDDRFLNEHQAIIDRGGITIRVNRSTLNRLGLIWKDEHSSETELDKATFNYTINNDGTIGELIEKVREILVKERII